MCVSSCSVARRYTVRNGPAAGPRSVPPARSSGRCAPRARYVGWSRDKRRGHAAARYSPGHAPPSDRTRIVPPVPQTLVLIAAGGAVGAVSRYLLDTAILDRYPGAFPLGILFVNVSGAFVVGLLGAWIVDRGVLPADLRAPLIVGFLGAYTTFSTLMLDSWRLVEDGLPMLALANLVGSMLLGIVAVIAGLWLGRSLG